MDYPPGCVNMWDLSRSGKPALIKTMSHDQDHVSAIYVDPAKNELVSLAGLGTVRVFDLRNLDKVVRTFSLMEQSKIPRGGAGGPGGPIMFGSVEKLDPSTYVSTMAMLGGPGGSVGTGIKTWDVRGKIHATAGVDATGLCVLRDDFQAFYVTPSDDVVSDELKSRMRVLIDGKDDLFDYIIKSDAGGRVCFPKAFLPDALLDAKKAVVLPDELRVDPDLVLELLFGTVTAIRVDQVYPLYAFFSHLGMKLHQLMMCKHAQSMASLTDLLAVVGTSRNAEMLRSDPTVTALEQACLNTLTDRLEEVTSDPTLSEMATRLNVLDLIKTHVAARLQEHPDLGFKKDDILPGSWESLASRIFSEVWESKRYPSVKLKTNDSAMIPAHLPILCCRTNWMAKILEFGGKEVETLRESSEVAVDLSFGSLTALLQYVHGGGAAVKSTNLSALLGVLDHMTRYNELDARQFFIEKIKKVSRDLGKGRGFSHAIAPVAHLLRNMEAFREVQRFWVDAKLIEVAALDALISDGERTQTLNATNVRMEAFEGEMRGVKERLGRLEASVEKVLSRLDDVMGVLASLRQEDPLLLLRQEAPSYEEPGFEGD